MELIDRSTLGREIPLKLCLPCPMGEEFECKDCLLDKALGIIEAAPTIDAVPVVRCGKCRYRLRDEWKMDGIAYVTCDLDGGSKRKDFFCGNGKIKEEDSGT